MPHFVTPSGRYPLDQPSSGSYYWPDQSYWTLIMADSLTLSRREMMALAGSAALLPLTSACKGGTPTSSGARPSAALKEPLINSSVSSLAHAIQAKQVSSVEVVQACLDRIDEVNPTLNAVVQLAPGATEAARAADEALARGDLFGPLHGVPMVIKDSLDTKGVISTGGTKGRENFVPAEDATVVRRLKEAGAILLGKTNTPELTLSFETTNLVYGRTNNPWDTSRTSGGSSGGAAAIVAAAGAPFDIGSDFGGSIRLPAHFCGIAGLKPSAGRVPRTGHIYPFGGVQDSFQQLGPLARYVEDLALILPLIAGPDFIDPGVMAMPLGDPNEVDVASLRIGFHTDNGIRTPTAETQSTIRAAAAALEAVSRRVEESRPAGVEQSHEIGWPMYGFDGGAAVRRLLRQAGTTETTLGGDRGAAMTAEELDQALANVYELRSRMLSYFTDYDAFLCPVNAHPAVPHGSFDLPDYSYTMTYNVTGWPGAVVRGGTSPEGLPIGVQVVGPPGREDVVLAVAAFVEAELGGWQPPTL